MSNSSRENLNHLTLYKKSLDIFKLSRQVASYITDDKDMISMYRSGSRSDNYADNLVLNAFRLVPKVAEAESEENSGVKLKYARSLRYYIDRIYKSCIQLENSKIRGKEFVIMLRKELKSLKKIHKKYVSALL